MSLLKHKNDLSKIICDSCHKHNKGSTYYNEFFYCVNCNWNICPFCREKHEKIHIIIRDDKKNLSCFVHKESFIKYCNKCKLNLCFSCIEQHNEHYKDIIPFENIKPDMKKIKDNIQLFRIALNDFNESINQIIQNLNYLKNNLEEYYKIYKDIVDNFENYSVNKRNYEIYQNVNEINNVYKIINEINNINENSYISKKVEKMLEIYDKMKNKDINHKNNEKDDSIKIITCKKCYSIPKITFLINNKIRIECSKCRTSSDEDISYFDEYLYPSLGKKDLNKLPNCSYCEKNKSINAIIYCYNCHKYLCEQCIKNHQIQYKNSHTFLEQKLENKIYCNKENYKENKFDKYCKICKDYLCPNCECSLEKKCFYYFNNSETEKKIKTIQEKIINSEKTIKNEEKNKNIFLNECNKKCQIY